MSFNEIRKKFLQFFEEKGHTVVSSSSLLPDDPSVLLTTAGMQQFKPYFTGKANPIKDFGSKSTTSSQKSFRTSDIEKVGDESHLTFFEMLGNFSFGYKPGDSGSPKGGYFKKGAVGYAYDFLVNILGIKKERLWTTVFSGEKDVSEDKESPKIWQEFGIPEYRIFKFGRKDNFWGPTGNEGPCGPTTEIHFELKKEPCDRGDKCIPNCECGRFIELWNIVFNEYHCKNQKLTFEKLKTPGVDTGMGLERLAMVVQNKDTVFETDLFTPIINEIKNQMGVEDAEGSSSLTRLWMPGIAAEEDIEKSDIKNLKYLRDWRIIADHIRGAVFLIADGVLPSNVEQGYILRRLIRRSIRYAKLLCLKKDFYLAIIKKIIQIYENEYPEVRQKETDIITAIKNEEEKFGKSLDKGLKQFDKLISKQKSKIMTGKESFNLYETYGFPLELTEELAQEAGLKVDRKSFEEESKKHQEVSRAGAGKKFGGHGLVLDTGEVRAGSKEEVDKVTKLHTATHLLHQVLRDVLGDSVRQMGSDINPERLRFDFSYDKKMTPEEIKKVEDIVNEKIEQNLEVKKQDMDYEEAIKSGALAFFKGKYPERVTVYSIIEQSGNIFSKEVCGGPHVKKTGKIGKFKIIKEESSGAGVRRIRAVVGES